MELTIGLWKIKDLCTWFGVSSATFSHKREKFLEELSEYCRYEDCGKRGIDIKEVYIPVYISKKTRPNIEKHFDEVWFEHPEAHGLNTIKNVANKMLELYPDEFTIKDGSMRAATGLVKKDWFGIYNKADTEKAQGSRGYCELVLCKRTDEGEYRDLTREELNIIKTIKEQAEKESGFKQVRDVFDYLLDSNLITPTAYGEYMQKIRQQAAVDFLSLKSLYELALGVECMFVTRLVRTDDSNNLFSDSEVQRFLAASDEAKEQ